MTPGSKLSGRRHNAGTPRVTRSNYCPRHPPGHSVDCDVSVVTSPITVGGSSQVDFWNDDTGRPAGEELDHVDIYIAAGTLTPPGPYTFLNTQTQQLTWGGFANPGTYTIRVVYWWKCLDSCQSIDTIQVDPPP